MNLTHHHSWTPTSREAVALQELMRKQVIIKPFHGPVRIVAGADVAFSKADDLVFAAVVVMSWPRLSPQGSSDAVTAPRSDFTVIETYFAAQKLDFPYVPGLLTFREGPAVLEAFSRVQARPDVVFFDGQGIAHPRRLGLASHLGLFLGLPSIGCAKSRLVGECGEPARERGGTTPLTDRGEVIGAVVRTRTGVRPLYVSPGHLIDLDSSVRLTLEACTRYRLPEPARAAHNLVSRLKAEHLARGAA
jgi:deoxyribonuclease V